MKHPMNHFSRLETLVTPEMSGTAGLLRTFKSPGTLRNILAAGCLFAVAFYTPNASAQFVTVLQDSQPYLLHGSSQGYLGVTIQDVDNDRAVALKLKDAKGAEIITVDHDAPAGKAGLQAQDVVLQMNGQVIEGAEQLRRLLRETPAGRSVTLLIGREGQQLNITTKLVDRKVLDHEAWGQHVDAPPQETAPAFAFDRGGTGAIGSDGWSFGGGSTSVGAVVDPLGAQLASYFGVSEGMGLLVKSVDRKSPAQAAGLRAGDVVLKINDDTMATRADWQRVLLANKGKQVQVTVVRDKKQQQLTMQAGNLKKKGALEFPGFCDSESREMLAKLGDLPGLSEAFIDIDTAAITAQAGAAAKGLDSLDIDAIAARTLQGAKNLDANALREQLQQAQAATKDIDVDAIRAQAEQAIKDIDVDAIRAQVDQSAKQLETIRKQTEEMKQQLQHVLPPSLP